METITGLTIRQPWASAIMSGKKDIENRTWSTSYRGPLVVHAGSSKADALAYDYCERLGASISPTLPRGVILGVVDLVDIVESSDSPWAMPGNLHWVLANPRPLDMPVAYLGRLGLLNVPSDLLSSALVAA